MKDLSCCEEVESKHDERMDLERKCQTLELLWQSEKATDKHWRVRGGGEDLVAYSEDGKEKGLFEGWLASAVAGAARLWPGARRLQQMAPRGRMRQAGGQEEGREGAGRRAWASRHRSAQRRT